MPKTLGPIPVGSAITDKDGAITIFFRLLWQTLVDAFQTTPTTAALDSLGLAAALVTTTLYLPPSSGQFRVNTTLTRTIDDGVSSSAAITVGFTQNGVAKTIGLTALTEASGLSVQGTSTPIYADATAPITVAMSYASNTAAKAHFDFHATSEWMA